MLDRRYRIDAPIARGGMSTVYRGLDTRLDRPVAVKIMDPKFAEDPQFVQRFEFEARAVARLSHPGLVAVYDHGRDGEHAFLVMELVEGGTLRELLRERGPMPPHAAAAVVRPVLDALAVAHRAGLVHRDIKPENILISDDGDVKIADFGLVRAIAASTVTSSSVILGTAAYLSPEQVTTGSASASSDVYGVGVVLFELLTGRTPFTGDTSLSIAYQRIDNDVPRPSTLIAGVPPQFDEVVQRATVRDPEHRYRNADDMARALRAAASALALPEYRVPAPKRSAEHLSSAAAGAPTTVAGNRPPSAHTQVVDNSPPPPQQHGVQHTRVVTSPTSRGVDDSQEPFDGPPPGPLPTGRRHYEFPDFDADRQRSRRAIVIWLLVVALLAVLVGFGGWWMGSGRYTAVPMVDGLDTTGATSAVEAAGLEAAVRGTYSDSVDTDLLIGTDPTGGSRIAKGDTVFLLVSLGSPTVPSIDADASVEDMEQQLRDRTFTPVDGGEAFSTSAPIGGVAALDPPPGTVLTTGSSVTVLRSKGAPPVEVPDVRGQSVDQARTTLESVGITVGEVREAFDEDTDGGKAIGTTPEAGETVRSGSTAVLEVSNAVTVPSLLGRSVGSARTTLETLGLPIDVRQVVDTDGSLVISQSPGAGSRVEPGSEVKVVSLP
ncbi:serine/threonine protein kinase [Rhodococcus sp. 15-725-2-2b]|uniref:Stk1 family PASTA domain-containing Ser/Thr kinase n=1 Tax=unclassified Rhodococcus (in: high G+C Gram-positive bacteria) TaxID=192944 RepID=UPI000B9C6D61|nr:MULTISPECIES: Stk1 family PASTA domain-containing Ser/Thr kinase [unclassified Rhodococcus (in: high G+C Gram-positive bacteria)]OZC64887.1 serine/threonine protein kinase [Rhodococcus sp. 06-469-3-2]OZD46741.1 serine/threonine protein kinase [Rhodococcus sp. 06-1477-1A]OZE71509.1 serine/threonine protein kinase [Rhodococcus sp. 15-725-2-2b]